MRVIKRFVKTCLFHLEMKENNTSYFVTCHPLSSLQSISMAYGQTATFLFSHYEFSKTLKTNILCYKLIFKSRAPITGPSKMKKRFLAFNAQFLIPEQFVTTVLRQFALFETHFSGVLCWMWDLRSSEVLSSWCSDRKLFSVTTVKDATSKIAVFSWVYKLWGIFTGKEDNRFYRR